MNNLINVFGEKKIKEALVIINAFEAEGVTDLRTVRTRLHDLVYSAKDVRVRKLSKKAALKALQSKKCPDCGSILSRERVSANPQATEFTVVYKCAKCRWSGLEVQ